MKKFSYCVLIRQWKWQMKILKFLQDIWTLIKKIAGKEMNEQAEISLRENWSKIIGPPGEG